MLVTSTMLEYQNQFEEQSTRVVGVPDFLLMEFFIIGLKPEVLSWT